VLSVEESTDMAIASTESRISTNMEDIRDLQLVSVSSLGTPLLKMHLMLSTGEIMVQLHQ